MLGLVEIPSGSLYLVAELFGLIAVINLAYVSSFIVLERKSLSGRRAAYDASGRGVPAPTAD